ncbi:uncharacterized protein N7487_010062 [Penicillium crustosum]|uniref:uncharacterized protein n=1 Tax=Penicillium crustosum TaxID=36656 RepID=UPI00239010DB|nr:uncharacterized protein N7487_010062 [Penicillium crustosum]KAJ5395759.1 hypothetical protein N7487_010062 [Penicillium crustosum]
MLDLRIHCIVRTIDNLANNTKLPYHPGPFIALIDASPAKTVKEDKTAHRDPTDIKVPAIASNIQSIESYRRATDIVNRIQGEKNQSSALGDPGWVAHGEKKNKGAS